MKQALTTLLAAASSLWLNCSGTPSSAPDASADARMQNTPDAALYDSSQPDAHRADAGSADACVPSKELCDNEDDDCDGIIDEDYLTGEPCNFDYLTTQLPGKYLCTSRLESECRPLCTLEEICLKQPCEDGGCTCPEGLLCPDAPENEPFSCLEQFTFPVFINRYQLPEIAVLENETRRESEILMLESWEDNLYRVSRYALDFELLSRNLVGFNRLLSRTGERNSYSLNLCTDEIVRSGDFLFFPGMVDAEEDFRGIVAYDLTHQRPNQFLPLPPRGPVWNARRMLLVRNETIYDIYAPREESQLVMQVKEYTFQEDRWLNPEPRDFNVELSGDCPEDCSLRYLKSVPSGFIAYWHHDSRDGEPARPSQHILRRLDQAFVPQESLELELDAQRWLVGLSVYPFYGADSSPAAERVLLFWHGSSQLPSVLPLTTTLEPLCLPRELSFRDRGYLELTTLKNGTGFAILEHIPAESTYILRRYNQEGYAVGREESYTYTHSHFPRNRIVGRENDYLLLMLNGSEGPHRGVVVPAR